MANRHFRALSAAALAGAAICLSWWLCDFAVQVASSLSLLKRLADDPKENAVVRKSASHALRTLEG